jgi:hypothetical protein
MGPTGNAQGSYKFYCLKTKKKLTRRRWDEIPMPRSIIKRVHRHAKADQMTKGLRFTNRNNLPYDFANEEYDEMPEELVKDEAAPYPEIPTELPGVDLSKNHEGVTPAVVEGHINNRQEAMAAARNANIALGQDMLEEGPVVIEPDEESIQDNEEPEIVEIPGPEPDAISVNEESAHEMDEPVFDGGADGIPDNERDSISVEPETSENEDDKDGEETVPRRSMRQRTKSTRLTWDARNQANVFAQYAKKSTEQEVDE